MSNTVKGAGRRKYAAQQAKHSQRTPLPPRQRQSDPGTESVVSALGGLAAPAAKPRRKSPTRTEALKEAVAVQQAANKRTAAKKAPAKKAPAKQAAPVAPASTKAGQFADKAEELGWEVERKRHEDGTKTVTATRGDETIVISWTSTEVFIPDATWQVASNSAKKVKNAAEGYRWLARTPEEALASVSATRAPRKSAAATTGPRELKRRVPFDLATAEDDDVLGAVQGHTIVWYNSFAEDYEEAYVPKVSESKSTVLATNPDTKRRTLAFCCPMTGYRACYVDAIQQVK